MSLNEAQTGYVQVTVQHVAGLLHEIRRLVDVQPVPLSRYQADLGNDEARRLRAFVELAHGRLVVVLDRLGIPAVSPAVSARRALRSTFELADIALAELSVRDLARYGTVDSGDASAVETAARELRQLLRNGAALIEDGPA